MLSGLRSLLYGGTAPEREDSSVKRANYKLATEFFENMVLGWSLEDIMNENLFKDEVKYIPERFDSVKEYLGSFITPLIEETRAELHNTLKSISEAPNAAVNFTEKIRPSKGAVVVYKMLIDREYDMGERDGKQSLMLKPKDILILSSRVPQYVEDLRDYMLAVVSRTEFQCEDTDGKNQDSNMLEVRAYVPDMHPFCSQNSNTEDKIFGIYVGHLSTNLRIWRALLTDLDDQTNWTIMLDKAVHCNREDSNEALVEENENDIERFRSKHFESHKLNVSQRSALVSAVNAVKNKEHPCIKLIQGPPGAVKTSMLVSLLSVLLHLRYKVLVCAPTNAAISEIAMRFLNVVRSPSDQCPDTDYFSCIVTLSDLVLVGNEERLNVEGHLGNIFLECRMDRLKNCCHPLKGWRKIVTYLLDFLESAISQYEAQQKDAINFLQFIRESLEKLASDFFNSAKILLNDYPGSISEKQNLDCLIKVVEHFVNLIQENGLEEKSLGECFSGNGEFCKEASRCTANFRESVINNKNLFKESLCSSRSECMHFLKRELCCERTLPNQDILKLCLSRAKVVFSTVSSSGKKYMNLAAPFDCLIIDEAAQLKEAESTIALQIAGITHAFMIGDPKQLPATVISKLAEKMNYGRSLFERLEKLGHSVHILDIQYRMHPWISLFPNREFYGNSIKNGPNVEVEPYGYTYLTSEMYGAYKFINVADGREEEDDNGMSKRNIIEAVVVKYILSKLYRVCSCRGNSISVGVVSPYKEQVLYLDRKLSTIKDEWKNILDVEVQSVDGFQGGEKDIIIISTVRTGKKIGFLSDDRRTNVALTRARFCLWIIGHGPSLLQSNSVWTKIVKDAKLRKCFLDSSMDPKIVKVIRKAKAELDQLEDLLNKDSVLFNNTVWKVLFSNEFKKSFTKIKRLQVRQRILGTILNMANGWRKTMKYGGHSEENLINEYSISGLYLLWSTDVQPGTESLQVLKIWNVLRLEEVPHFRTRLENIFGTYTPQYIERCKAKVFDRERKFLLPRRWEDDPHFVWYRSLQQPERSASSQCNPSESVGVPLEHAKVEESLLLMKFYALSSGIANQLLTAQDGSEIDLQFEVNEEESRIIRFPRSLFILGRSGTGKTTVLVIRLLQKEQQAKLALHGLSCHRQNEFQVEERNERREGQQVDLNGSNIKQMFVTVSAKLCSAIRSNIARVDRSALGKDQDTFMAMHERSDGLSELQNIPDSFIDLPNKNFPLVITFRKFLMMLDGTVEDHFSDGPMRSTNRKSRAFKKTMRTREVDYDRFESMYWPHFNADLKRRLDSSVVFTEIISHIKGSLISLNSSNFIMSQKDYILMADCQISTLNVSQREAIYDLFLLYEKKKKTNGDFDIADIVNHLHRQLRCNPYLGQKLDFIYVDEVQDLTISQITLLKYVCSNVHEGYVFAGDTAQTIARGVSFRFQEIRNLYYREFLAEDGKNDLSSKNSMADLFHLCQNFRTHSGIIKLAQSVMDLLYHFFPFAVDKLPPETSLIFGEAPILLGGNIITELFGGNSGTATAEGGRNFGRGKYEFGAEQVILVRDDHAKEQVLGQVGQQSLVLTITECKGLEFQDVLLYNFFTSSPLGSKWRVIYEFFNQVTLNNFNQKRHPEFDNSKHILICSELKYLYVAITRAKQRLWIQEENHEYSVLDYWKEKGLAQWKNLDRSFVDSLCVVSSRVDWKQRGIQMFQEQLYDTAIVCFEKAMYSHSKIAKWAKAASLQQSGQRLLERDPEAAKNSLREAAECFLSIDKPDLAADCFIIMGDYKEAGTIYLEKFGETRLEDAGNCFALAKCWDDAASAYGRDNCISKCLDACLKGELFMGGLKFIKHWKRSKCNKHCGKCHGCELLNLETETEYLKESATHYHRIKDTQSMMIFVKALPSLDLIRSFLLKKDYFDELVGVEAAAGNFEKAAEIAEMKGDFLLESEMRLKAGQYWLAIKSILFHVQLKSLRMCNKGWPLEKFHGKIELLKKVKDIAGKKPNHVDESINFEVEILSDELYTLSSLTKQKIRAEKMRNIRHEILCLRKALHVHLDSDLKIFQLDQGMSLFKVDDYSKTLLENRISPKTLVFLWDEWKHKLISSVNSLSRFEKRQEEEQDILYLEYALEYFCVRKSKNARFCTVFNSEAFWLKGDEGILRKRRGNTAQIGFQKFLELAKYFFTMDLYYVGQHVIEKLERLYDFCTRENSSLPEQGYMLLKRFEVSETLKNIELLTGQSGLPQVAKFGRELWLQMYQVFKSLKNMEHLTAPTGLRQETKFDVVLNDCKERFLYFFFPLKHGTKNVKEFISLREDATAILILQDISEDIVSNMRRPPTLGQIGILQVVLPLLPTDLVSQYLMKISRCLDDTHYWNDQMLWLHINTFPEISSQDKRMCLVKGFEKALCSSFNSWENIVYISPHIFLTLLEKLFLLASSCRHLSTGLCLPRSFFIEFMTGKQGEFFHSWLLESESQPGCEGSSENFYVPLRDIISKLLLDKHRTVKRWIETSNIKCREYFPEFILRLISMLCLISINSTGKLTDNAQLFRRIFRDSQSTEVLPFEFRKRLLQLLKCSSNQKAFLINLSKAMRVVNNPLVVIYFNDSHKRIDCKDVIILTQKNLSCKKTVLQAVFQEKDDQFSSNERKEDFENHDIWIQD